MKDPDWYHNKDPYDIIPIGFKGNGYTLIGFCSPAGKGIKRLMARIKYDKGGKTTLNYLTVLYHYFKVIDFKTFVDNHL